MNGIMDFLKILYCRNKLLFLVAVLVIVVLAVIAGNTGA